MGIACESSGLMKGMAFIERLYSTFVENQQLV